MSGLFFRSLLVVLGLLWGAGAAGGRDNTPFSLVKVQFTSNFKYPSPTGEKQIEAGQTVVVPLVWLDWLVNKQRNDNFWTGVRIGVDAVVLVASVSTGQPEFLVIVDGIISGTDIVVQLSSDAVLSSNNQALKNTLATWDGLYGFYGLGREVAGPGNLRQIVLNRQNWVNAINSAKQIPNKIRGTADLFYRLYKVIKNSTDFKIVSASHQTLFGNVVYKFAIETTLASHCSKLDEVMMVLQGDKVVVGLKASLANGSNQVMTSVADVAMDVETGSIALSNLRLLPEGKQVEAIVETVNDVKCIGYSNPVSFNVVRAVGGGYWMVEVKADLASFMRDFPKLAPKLNSLSDEASKVLWINEIYAANRARNVALINFFEDVPDGVKAWEVLQFIGKGADLSLLKTISQSEKRFLLGNLTGYDALIKIVKAHPSKLEFVNNLVLVDDVFSKVPNIKYTGLSSSPRIRIVDNEAIPIRVTSRSQLKLFEIVDNTNPKYFTEAFFKSFEFEFEGIIIKADNIRIGNANKNKR